MLENYADCTWHALSADAVVDALATDAESGLTSAAATERRAQFGVNQLTARHGTPPWKRFIQQFRQPLVYILIAASLVTLLLHEFVDAGVIFGVVLLNAVVGYMQEAKAAEAIEALARVLNSTATVLRDGLADELPTAELVPGDIIVLQSGDRVPADARLIKCRDLRVEEAALTGESVPTEKQVAILDEDLVINDRCNMAFASTLVTYGQATAVVTATGDYTEIGRISRMIAEAHALETPLMRKIHQFSGVLMYVILGLAAMTFVVGTIRGMALIDIFMATVALAVAAIPEGLPAALTITLAIGVKRMAARNAIIRKLPAVEALGSTTVICSDKTGTLTRNEMMVQEVVAAGSATFSGVGYDPDNGRIDADAAADNAAILAVLQAGALCNDSSLSSDTGTWTVEGDPTEGALLAAASRAGIKAGALATQWPRIDSIPFESEHQYMATLHRTGKTTTTFIKGSVEAVLQRCVSALDADGQSVGLDTMAVHADVDRLAGRGCRVLAFARLQTEPGKTDLQHADLTGTLQFLGLQAMLDPPRSEAVDAIRACQAAGIKVKMITGDHARTAAAIAGQLGIGRLSGCEPNVVNGKQISEWSDEELLGVAESTDVFARTSPEQKLRLVRMLQQHGHVVAMTGDGVNDAPALKQADIGVGMGNRGTEVAKEASDMILTDDNFATIAAAVEEGRGVFDNLIKFITWTLPTNVAEGLIILVAVAAGTALPVQPVQILWINMTTAICLGMTLAFEPRESGIMQRPPRPPNAPILSTNLVGRIILVGVMLLIGAFGLFRWGRDSGMSVASAQTVAANLLVFGELFYLFNCRSLKKNPLQIGLFTNLWLILGIVVMISLQLAFTYAPTMQKLFGTAPIGADAWLRTLTVCIGIFIVIEIEKFLQQKYSQ